MRSAPFRAPSLPRWLRGPEWPLAALLVAVTWFATAGFLAYQLDEAQYAAEAHVTRLSAAFAESVGRRVDLVDAGLLEVQDAWRHGRAVALSEVAARMPAADTAFQLALIGPDGMLRGSSLTAAAAPVDLSDRAHFRVHADHRDRDLLFVSRPVLGRVSGRPSLQFSRRLTDEAGRFAGVVVASVDPGFLTSIVGELAGGRGQFALVGDDGVVRSATPGGVPEWLAEAVSRSSVDRSAQFLLGPRDRPEAVVRAQGVPGRPLRVLAILSGDAALQAYDELRDVLIAVATLLSLLLLVGAALLARRRLVLATSREALAASREAMAEAVENIRHGIAVFTPDGRLAVANHRASEAMGVPHDFLQGRPFLEEITRLQFELGVFGEVGTAFPNATAFLAFARSGWTHTDHDHVYERRRSDGTMLEVRTRALPSGGAVRTYADVTDRYAAEVQARHFALHDAVTGLPGRALLAERLDEAVAERPCSLLFIGLDHFAPVNLRHGHAAGDRLLAEAAARIRSALPAGTLLARHAGDEFAALLVAADPGLISRAVIEAVQKPFEVAGGTVVLGASIGIARAPDHGLNAVDLLRGADCAMHRAKQNGRSTFAFHAPQREADDDQASLMSDLRAALAREEFRLVYQPVVETASRRISGFEALIRWNHPTRGEISPATFIPLAEAGGLILPIGAWVLRTACAEAAGWPGQPRVAVNVSPPQFLQPDLCDQVRLALEQAGLPANRLDIEVTEGLLLEDAAVVLRNLTGLRAMGVRTSLDDFGTGHSGLSTLRRFPFDRIKLDRSFVRNLGTDAPSHAIVSTVVDLARSLRLEVVAEGVENESQLEELRLLRCRYVQGYLLGRPLLPADAVALLRSEASEESAPASAVEAVAG